MDPRQQPPLGVPFSRNVASPTYGRSPFPPTSSSTTTPAPYPPASHPQSHPSSASPAAGVPYAEHQRRPSDGNPYFHQHQSRPPYAPEPTSHIPHPAQTHVRHQSSSSIGGSLSRNMAPPSPPPQQPHLPPGHQMGQYGFSPAPRAPPPGMGPSGTFPSGRELPALSSIQRTGSTGGSMSLSAMLSGPPAPREPTPGHAGHPSFPPPATSSAGSGPGPAFAGPMPSPRMQNASAEYNAYGRRPQTPPEHTRQYDPRDQRGSAAGSPPQVMYGTPEVSRYGTPQAYPQRAPPMTTGEDRRDQPSRMSTGSMPPRPSSQPRAYSGMSGRPVELGRGPPPGEPIYGRREEMRPGQGQGPAEFNPERPPRAMAYDEQRRMIDREREIREQFDREAEWRERERLERARFEDQQQRHFQSEQSRMERERAERERMDRERDMELRERDRRERTTSDPSRPHSQRPVEYGPHGPPGALPPQYARADPRDQGSWQQRPGFEQPQRIPYDQSYPGQQQRPGEYPGPAPGPGPTTTGPAYAGYPAHTQPPMERYPQQGPAPHIIPTSQPGPPYDSPERHRFGLPQHQQQAHSHHGARPSEEGPPPPSLAYNGGPGTTPFEGGRHRPAEDGHVAPSLARQQSGGLLAVGEINRKGRISPLPQPVQGPQAQVPGPPAGPEIKREFGRIYSGIGSGTIRVSSPVPTGGHPFTNAGLARRDDIEPPPPEVTVEPAAKPTRKRNRKAKDEDAKGDDDSTGRLTPVGRGTKRPKTHGKQHRAEKGTCSHHHHHHAPERTASPLHALKAIKSGTPNLSPTMPLTTHNHQIPRPTPAPKAHLPSPPAIPKPKKLVNSQAVLDSIAHKERKHLGDFVYNPILKPTQIQDTSGIGYASTPTPLPMEIIKNNENSTLMVKVDRRHLEPGPRREMIKRQALWGTDVYTDDSDVISACIHGGWIRGEWQDETFASLLDLEFPPPKSSKNSSASTESQTSRYVLTEPPPTGPVHIPPGRDMQVMVLILPALEKYGSSTRFGLTSREWGGPPPKRPHDGLSFKVLEVRFVIDGAAPQNRLRGKGRRDRINRNNSALQRSKFIDFKAVVNGASSENGKGVRNGLKTSENGTAKRSDNGEDVNKENRPATNGGNRVKDSRVGGVRVNGVDMTTTKTTAGVTANGRAGSS
ncbi:histone deacetylation protein Rxt3-domain-containing protein [Pseudomassariella vexata]|uniref:Histone deacetylation protein Rxt3-domain-containing protein n=1 Tax=Pseudomassariella vexata TaxID=1141098 RepID=A0A1Y2DH10_9PEZI|nr:histone deacetylation protein Rxt3-domain-containing protein [Pseudomassariella vexata]ORY58551.1 histone deacetylation protein Rxt3-domain-containing protein [Pseudomassariella vexata]